MTGQKQQLYKSLLKLWEPPPELSVSEWADKERRLSSEASAEPGRWRTDRAPYQGGILNSVLDPLVEQISVMSSAQVGKTELLLNIIGYFVDYDPSPILLLQPTIEMAQAFSKDRLAPMVRDTPALKGKIKDSKSRDSGNTILHKSFAGGHITMAGANSPASLASRPIRILLADEPDRYPASAGTEGDPFNLAMKRTTTFWNRKIIAVSTPTVKGASRIEKLYEESSKERYFLPCPSCGELQPLSWKNIDFETFGHACEACGSISSQDDWLRYPGVWIAENPDQKKHRGFHLNELVSPWRRWPDIIGQFLRDKASPETLKTFINTSLGETWEDKGEEVDGDEIYRRREHYETDIPEQVCVLTCAVDVQDDRLELEVVGWAAGYERFSIEFKILRGDPSIPAVWESLDQEISRKLEHPSGHLLGIACTVIDSGGHFTQQVYQFCKPREIKRVYAIKGVGGAGKPLVGRASKSNKGKVSLLPIGVDTGKESVMAHLQIFEPGPGYYHFPVAPMYDEEYFAQLTAETCLTTWRNGVAVRKWKQTRKRNEAFDLAVYNLAALYILNPNFEKLSAKLIAADADPEPEQELSSGQQYQQARKKNLRKKRNSGNFATSWR